MDKSLYAVLRSHLPRLLLDLILENAMLTACNLMDKEKEQDKIPAEQSFRDIPLSHYAYVISNINPSYLADEIAHSSDQRPMIGLNAPQPCMAAFLRLHLKNPSFINECSKKVKQILTEYEDDEINWGI
jgi:hypothetical protein